MFGQGFTSDVWNPTRGLSVPTLLLWARRGDFPRTVFDAFAARLVGARIEEIDSGHLAPMEQPELVALAVLGFTGLRGPRQVSTDGRVPSSR